VDMLRLHLRPTSRVHAVVSEGGTAPNIIPDRAACFVEARSPRLEGVEELFGFIFDSPGGPPRQPDLVRVEAGGPALRSTAAKLPARTAKRCSSLRFPAVLDRGRRVFRRGQHLGHDPASTPVDSPAGVTPHDEFASDLRPEANDAPWRFQGLASSALPCWPTPPCATASAPPS